MRVRSTKNKELKVTINQIDIETEPPVKKPRTANIKDITAFCNELGEALEYIYFGGTWW